MKRLIIFVFLVIPLLANGDVRFEEKTDDFSSEKKYILSVSTQDEQSGTIFISCNPGNKLEVQLGIRGTMFPDDIKGNRMLISTTHKFDKAEDAVRDLWTMNMMRYQNSWYQGDHVTFVRDAIRSNQLNLRLDGRGEAYRFNLQGTAVHLRKILSNCGVEP